MIKSAEVTKEEPGDEIIITHYVNPQLFWYYKTEYLKECAHKFRKIEKELQRYHQPGLSNQDYEGYAKIILEYQPMGKLIRAQILHVLRRNPKNLDAGCIYIVWAMDYGFPIETTEDHMSPLPEQLGGSHLHIQRGGVGFVVPAAQQAGSVNDRLKRHQNLNWHVYACNNFESKLCMSKLRFDAVFQTRCGQNFGNLFLYSNGDVCTAAEFLISQQFGKPCESNFSEICMQSPATRLCSWLTIDGKSNAEQNCKQFGERARCRDITQKVEIIVGLANAQVIMQSIQARKVLDKSPKNGNITDENNRIVNETTFDNGFLNEPDNFQKLVHNQQQPQCGIDNGHTRYRRKILNLKDPAQQVDKLDAILQKYDEFSLIGDDNESNKLISKNKNNSSSSRRFNKLDQLLNKKTNIVKLVPSTSNEQINDRKGSNNDAIPQEKIPSYRSISISTALSANSKKHDHPKTLISEKQENDTLTKVVSKFSANLTNETPIIATEEKLVKAMPIKVPNMITVYEKPIVTQTAEKLTHPKLQMDRLDEILRDEEFRLKPANGKLVKTKKPKEQTTTEVTRILTDPQNTLLIAEKLNTHDIVATQTFFCDHLVVAHTNVPLNPTAHGAKAGFTSAVLKAMYQYDFKETYRTQCFAWPHILAGNSMILINGPKSGRTWSYLPALCSQIFQRIEMSLDSSERISNGPMAIVLVANTNQAQYITKSCENLLAGTTLKMRRVVAAFAGQNNNDVRIKLHNRCAILVVTPPQLTLLLEQNELEQLIVPEVLKHIVIDDIDLMHAHNPAECRSLIVKLLKLCRLNKARQLEPQLIMISEYWDAQYMSAIVQRARAPLLLFGDFLEAAAYAHVNLNIKYTKNIDKIRCLLDFLETRNISDRTVVFCKDGSEVVRVKRELERADYMCMTYNENSDINSRQSINFWKHEILICTDSFWQDLDIQNVLYLIHYSLPNSWSKFTRRFATIAQHFKNALTMTGINERKENLLPTETTCVLVLLDESNHLEIPRFKDFMDKHKIQVPPLLIDIAKQSRRKREELRVSKGYTVCQDLTTYGSCDEFGCMYRHTLTCNDAVPLDRQMDIPEKGVVSVQLLKVYEPNHFAVRILKHRALDSQIWVTSPNQTNFARLGFKLNMHFSNPENNRVHWPQAVQDVCVLKVGSNFQRVRILYVPECPKKMDPLNAHVQVQILDVNTDIMSRKAGDLLACPMEFRLLPPLAIDMRLIGVVPYSGERVWLPSATKLIERELQPNNCAKNEQVLAIIDFSLVHTIFIKNLIVVEHLQTLGTDTYKVNLKQFLWDKGLAKADNEIALKLYDMFADLLSEASKKNPVSNTSPIEDDDESNNSFKSALSDWKNDDDDNITKSDSMKVEIATKCIDEITITATKPSESIKYEESWCDLPLNEPKKIEIFQAKECSNWSGFHIRNFSVEDQRSFDELQRRMETYIDDQQPACVTSLNNFKHGKNFILKNNDEFMRAKLLTTSSRSELPVNAYQFLLVDFGYTLIIEANALKKSLLYESTPEINTLVPYQAIYCKLAGIVLHDSTNPLKIEGKHLYAVAKRECLNPMEKVQMHAYEIVLYECNTEDDLEKGIMLNKHLVHIGVAAYDENSKIYLTLENKKSNAIEPIDSLKALKQCMDEIMDLEEDERGTTEMFFTNIFKKEYNDENETKAVNMSSIKEESVNNSLTESNVSSVKLNHPMPTIVSASKRPQVTWYQTSAFLHFSIEAAEVTDYVVSCDGKHLFYLKLSPHDTTEEFHILLRGLVVVVGHEKRGLKVIIKLRKVCCGFWPSLLKGNPESDGGKMKALYKLPWLKYNLEHAKTSSQALSHAQQTLLLQSRQDAGLNKTHYTESDESSNSMSDDEFYGYKCNNEGNVGADDDIEVESKEYPVY